MYGARSTGTVVGYIIDGDSSSNFSDISFQSANTEYVEGGTFSGSLVNCQAGDVIVFEAWVYTSDMYSARKCDLNYYYDGTTANTTDFAVVSNHTSFLETPETLVFGAPPAGPTGRPYHSFSCRALYHMLELRSIRSSAAKTICFNIGLCIDYRIHIPWLYGDAIPCQSHIVMFLLASTLNRYMSAPPRVNYGDVTGSL